MQRTPSRHARLTLAAIAALLLGAEPSGAQVPDAVWTGQQAFNQYGTAVANVGDCDGDGHDDVAIGAPHADVQISFPITFMLQDVGRVDVRSGRTGAMLHSWYGSAAGAEFGFSVAGAGDVDGDGRDDVLIGIPRYDGLIGFEGKVQLRSGATGALLRTHTGNTVLGRYGHAVAGGGEFTGDTTPDYVIGAPMQGQTTGLGGFDKQGKVWSINGATGLPHRVDNGGVVDLTSFYPGAPLIETDVRHLGWSVAVSGAFVGMGGPRADWTNFDTGETRFLSGFVRVVDVPNSKVANRTGTEGSLMGTAVSLADVLVGDAPELAYGQPGFNGYGLVTVATPTFDMFDSWDGVFTAVGTLNAPIGEVVRFVGDVDGDQLIDLAVGSPYDDNGTPFGIADVGRVRLYDCAAEVLLETYSGTSFSDQLGTSVAGLGEQGVAGVDIVCGVPGDDTFLLEAGAAWLFEANPCPGGVEYYGLGLPGFGGVPLFLTHAAPKIGQSVSVELWSSASTPTTTWLFLGATPIAAPFMGGTLLVDAFTTFPLPIGSNPLVISSAIPEDPALCGVSLFLQHLVVDAGAVQGVAFSRGMELILGS